MGPLSSAVKRLQGPIERRPWRWRAVLYPLSGLVWAGLARFIELHSIHGTLASLTTLSFWLTALFFLLTLLPAALLTRSLFLGNLAVGLPGVVLSFINYFKVSITSTPLSIGDLSLVGKVGDIASLNKESLVLGRNGWLALVGALVWLLIALLFSKPLRLPWRQSLPGAAVGALTFFLVFWAGANRAVYLPLGADTAKTLSQATVNEACGMPLGLWRSFYWRQQQTARLGKDYSKAYMEEILQRAAAYGGESSPAERKKPHIILLLSESFFDITTLEGVTYPEDPIADFHALQQESVSGTFYTRSLGYGTCNIELEILTGLNTGLLAGEDLFNFDTTLLSQIPSVPYLLGENGYRTGMLHMFNDSIYSRGLFFPSLGFEDLYFSGDFGAIYPPLAGLEESAYWEWMSQKISGGCYSDDFLTDLLCSWYEQLSPEGPVFLYGISMENHGPHADGKYGPEELTVQPQSALTGEAAEGLLYTSQGISNASKALGRLTDYFRDCQEPVVIVFFGDHKPGLGLSGGGSVYSELGIAPASGDWSLEERAVLYSADYLIWSNDPAYLPGEPGSRQDTSCNYLGAILLDIAGVEEPAYWRLISQLRQHRLLDTVGLHISRDGVLQEDAPEGEEGLELLSILLRDAIYGKRYVTGLLRSS